jgi:hypothetical protein
MGFLPRPEELALPRLRDRLESRTLELLPAPGVRFGALDVRVVGWPDGFRRPAASERLGQLNLDPPQEFGKGDWILGIDGRDLDGRRITGVPQGDWRWSFYAASQLCSIVAMAADPPLIVRVGPATSELRIDLTFTGHLELDVAPLDRAGRRVDRSILIRPARERVQAHHRAKNGRLELPFLRPGDYIARTQRTNAVTTLPDSDANWHSIAFTIAAGAITRCTLPVDE